MPLVRDGETLLSCAVLLEESESAARWRTLPLRERRRRRDKAWFRVEREAERNGLGDAMACGSFLGAREQRERGARAGRERGAEQGGRGSGERSREWSELR